MNPQQYCLRWKHHHSNVQNMFAQLLEKERFCDVTLYCSPSFATQVSGKDAVQPQNVRGVSLRAHRVVLASCSELLGALLGAHEAQGEPVLVIDGAEPKHLKALLDYMYTGEMHVHYSQLASVLKTADELRIKGLTEGIRWNNKDEPPDCDTGLITTATPADPKPQEKHHSDVKLSKHLSPKHSSPKHSSPKLSSPKHSPETPELKPKDEEHKPAEKFNVNGGPPPLIKLVTREKSSPAKREHSDSESRSPKRQRRTSRSEHTDEESLNATKLDRDQEWQHGNLDITAERVVGWGLGSGIREGPASASGASTSRDASDDEWADPPADIGSFLHTKLKVDGDNSADEESNESAHLDPQPTSAASSLALAAATSAASELRVELAKAQMSITRPTIGPKSGPTDPRFTDVVKLSDYLQHGRRPQFWEENYVKRVMEAVRHKELEMKQAAEILGVSYGTLYGRYRDVYGCINRPYRAVRDFWQSKGPSDVLERLQRGEVTLEAAATALGVSMANLAAHVADFSVPVSVPEKDFEQPIPIETDPSLKMRPRTYSGGQSAQVKPPRKTLPPANTNDKPAKKVLVGSMTDEEPIPATVITTYDPKQPAASPAAPSGKWPSIRVASLDTLRGAEIPTTTPSPASPSALMRTRPDLTIVAARKPHPEDEEHT